MRTGYQVLKPDGTIVESETDWPHAPGYVGIKSLVEPLLDGGTLERVSVLHNGRATDMFVDGDGVSKGLGVNIEATKIYRANWLTRYPETDPNTLSAIYGTAVLFARRIWF